MPFISENQAKIYATRLAQRISSNNVLTQHDYKQLSILFDSNTGGFDTKDQEEATNLQHEQLAIQSEIQFLECFSDLHLPQKADIFRCHEIENNEERSKILREEEKLTLLKQGLRRYQLFFENNIRPDHDQAWADVDLNNDNAENAFETVNAQTQEKMNKYIGLCVDNSESQLHYKFNALDGSNSIIPDKLDIARKMNIDSFIETLEETTSLDEFKTRLADLSHSMQNEFQSVKSRIEQQHSSSSSNSQARLETATSILADRDTGETDPETGLEYANTPPGSPARSDKKESHITSTPDQTVRQHAPETIDQLTRSTMKCVAKAKATVNPQRDSFISKILAKENITDAEKGRQLALFIEAGANYKKHDQDEIFRLLQQAEIFEELPEKVEKAFGFLIKEINAELIKCNRNNTQLNHHLHTIAHAMTALQAGEQVAEVMTHLKNTLEKDSASSKIKRSVGEILLPQLDTATLTVTDADTEDEDDSTVRRSLFQDDDTDEKTSLSSNDNSEDRLKNRLPISALASQVNTKRQKYQNYPELHGRKQLAIELLSTYKHYLTEKLKHYTYWSSGCLGFLFKADLKAIQTKYDELNKLEQSLTSGEMKRNFSISLNAFSQKEEITYQRNTILNGAYSFFTLGFGDTRSKSEKLLSIAQENLANQRGHYGLLFSTHPEVPDKLPAAKPLQT